MQLIWQYLFPADSLPFSLYKISWKKSVLGLWSISLKKIFFGRVSLLKLSTFALPLILSDLAEHMKTKVDYKNPYSCFQFSFPLFMVFSGQKCRLLLIIFLILTSCWLHFSKKVNKVFYTRVSPKKVTYKVSRMRMRINVNWNLKNELTLTKSIPPEYSSVEQSPQSPKEDVYCIYYV